MTAPLPEYSELISAVSEHLSDAKIQYALVGGLAASLYRSTIRATDDIDFIVSYGEEATTELASLGQKLTRKIVSVRKAELEGGPLFAIKRKSTPIVLVRLVDQENPRYLPLDFILANNPWVPAALNRAAPMTTPIPGLPLISAEDLIIAKLIALQSRPDRLQDAQDVKEILVTQDAIDWSYLKHELVRHAVLVPQQFKDYFPETLEKILKGVRRARK